MTKTPVFLMEEHHEAFLIWHYAISQNIIPKSGNTLLHIDEHADMAAPRFNRSLNTLNGNLQDIYNFTYSELSIASFIVPAIYQQLFNQVFWIWQKQKGYLSEYICVSACDREGQILLKNQTQNISQLIFNPNYKLAKYSCQTLQDEFSENQAVVLDIDLDYFSCNHQYLNLQGKIEVTQEQYQDLNRDRYHFLRTFFGSAVRTEVEAGKYYLLFNNYANPEAFPNPLKVSEEEILNRIDRVINFLVQKRVQVKMIDICRSRISGYTPADQCQFIEDNLLKKLGELYELKHIAIEEVYQREKIAV
ncbi:MAG: UPF0489 family protein [Actinomycetota bacterium]